MDSLALLASVYIFRGHKLPTGTSNSPTGSYSHPQSTQSFPTKLAGTQHVSLLMISILSTTTSHTEPAFPHPTPPAPPILTPSLSPIPRPPHPASPPIPLPSPLPPLFVIFFPPCTLSTPTPFCFSSRPFSYSSSSFLSFSSFVFLLLLLILLIYLACLIYSPSYPRPALKTKIKDVPINSP